MPSLTLPMRKPAIKQLPAGGRLLALRKQAGKIPALSRAYFGWSTIL
jgi:hypothetical protein